MKLFLYYSLTGTGDKISNTFKDKGYDILKVEVEKPLPKNFFLSMMVGGYKAMSNYEEKLINFNLDSNKYDEIVIGSPIWNSRLCSPISTVLRKLDLTNKKVSFILYSGSGKPNKAMDYLKENYPNSLIINLPNPFDNIEKVFELL